MGGEVARLVDFPLIGLLDTLLRFSAGVCSLRKIWERPLVGPFLYISDTILNTSSIFFNFSSNISFLIDCLPLLCHSPSLLLGLFRNCHCSQQLTFYILYSFLVIPHCLLFYCHWVDLVVLTAVQLFINLSVFFFPCNLLIQYVTEAAFSHFLKL